MITQRTLHGECVVYGSKKDQKGFCYCYDVKPVKIELFLVPYRSYTHSPSNLRNRFTMQRTLVVMNFVVVIIRLSERSVDIVSTYLHASLNRCIIRPVQLVCDSQCTNTCHFVRVCQIGRPHV